MESGDLFSFLSDTADKSDQDGEEAIGTSTLERSAKKRKNRVHNEEIESLQTDIHNEPGPSTKRTRLASPKPIVLDEFETEAKREVEGSAGLTNGVEAGRLELRHQASLT